MLRDRIRQNGRSFGEPGQVVWYTPSPGGQDRVDVTLGDQTVPGVGKFTVMPFDAGLIPSRVYLMIAGEQSADATRCPLARAAVRWFPQHPLAEEIFAFTVGCAEREAPDDKGAPREAQQRAREYLSRYPGGKYRDRFEWQLVQWDHYVYEYEGEAGAPMAQAGAYEKFLAGHPDTAVADDIRLKLGYLYRVIHECLEKPGHPERAWREKAQAMYASVVNSGGPPAREQARVALYNLSHGRHVYSGADDW